MALQLDHAVIAVNDLDRAVQDYQDLGFNVIRGGRHANQATHNALMVFADGTYLELLAPTGNAPVSGLIDFGRMLISGEGLVGFALRTDDIEAEASRLQLAGFEIGEILVGTREKDGRVIQWKLALIDDGFAPFLIQDVTPRARRIPDDPDLITHKNRAVGIPAVEIAVREMAASWERYTRLLGITPEPHASNYRTVGNMVLHEYTDFASNYALDELPDYLKPFAGTVPQAEIDQVNPDNEPQTFKVMLDVGKDTLTSLRSQAERERAMASALRDKPEALFAIHLIREEAKNALFTLERTHGVRFQQFTGVPSHRGIDILKGLNDIDWSAVHHAYGAATDVPALLRALTSDDEAVRNDAHEILLGSIVHQGTIYTASIDAIPFLVQMIDAPDVDKAAPLNLLGYITFGGSETPHLKERTREKLQAALPTFVKNLSHPDADVRRYIAEQLVLYSAEADLLTPLMQERIRIDPDLQVRARCLTSLAEIWTNHLSEENKKELSDHQQTYISDIMRDSSYPMAVRSNAAYVLIQNNPAAWLDEATALLYRMMETDRGILRSLGDSWIGGIFFRVLRTLEQYPEIALRWVIAQTNHPEPEVRKEIGTSLRELADKGQSVEQMLPTLYALMRDPVPDVREKGVAFFYTSVHARIVTDVLHELAEHDPSLTVRTVARNTLDTLDFIQ